MLNLTRLSQSLYSIWISQDTWYQVHFIHSLICSRMVFEYCLIFIWIKNYISYQFTLSDLCVRSSSWRVNKQLIIASLFNGSRLNSFLNCSKASRFVGFLVSGILDYSFNFSVFSCYYYIVFLKLTNQFSCKYRHISARALGRVQHLIISSSGQEHLYVNAYAPFLVFCISIW